MRKGQDFQISGTTDLNFKEMKENYFHKKAITAYVGPGSQYYCVPLSFFYLFPAPLYHYQKPAQDSSGPVPEGCSRSFYFPKDSSSFA